MMLPKFGGILTGGGLEKKIFEGIYVILPNIYKAVIVTNFQSCDRHDLGSHSDFLKFQMS